MAKVTGISDYNIVQNNGKFLRCGVVLNRVQVVELFVQTTYTL